MKKGLFDKARSKAEPKKSASKDEKVRIDITSHGETGEMFDKISELEELQKQIKIKQTKADIISDEIKLIGRDEWAKLFTKRGVNPGSIMLETIVDGNTAQCMFMAQDKFAGKIDEKRHKELTEKYGEELVTEKTTYKFNADMLEKYADIISDLISNSPDIDDRDKEKIIEASVEYSITKGTLDQLKNYGEVRSMMEELNPVVALRDVEVINE